MFKMKGPAFFNKKSPLETNDQKGDYKVKEAKKEMRNANFDETNAALAKTGKPTITREKYDSTLDKK